VSTPRSLSPRDGEELRPLDCDAGAMFAHVQLHVGVETGAPGALAGSRRAEEPGRGGAERARRRRVVADQAQAHAGAHQRRGARQLVGRRADGEQDVVEARGREVLGLGQRRDRDRPALGAQRLPDRRHALDRLHVRAQAQAEALAARRHAPGVAAQAPEVEQQRRRGQLVERGPRGGHDRRHASRNTLPGRLRTTWHS
jgi:hypothetical protein